MLISPPRFKFSSPEAIGAMDGHAKLLLYLLNSKWQSTANALWCFTLHCLCLYYSFRHKYAGDFNSRDASFCCTSSCSCSRFWTSICIWRASLICVLCCSLKFQNILNELLNWRIGASCWDDAYAPFKFQRTLWMSSSIIQLLGVLGASRLRLATCAAANWKGIGTSNSQDMYSFSVSMKCRIHEFPSLVSIKLNKHWLFSFLWSLDLLSWILHTVHSVWPSPSQVVWTLHWLLCDDQLAKNK